MPLQSKQFSGDKRLEACLVQDSAHVLLGDHGPYVLKIQQAVVILCGEAIPIRELEDMRYGPGTAAAVLAYKREHAIINRAYQSKPDDIVGKMTIKSLDDGMLRYEAQLAAEPSPPPGPHPPSPEPNQIEVGAAIATPGAHPGGGVSPALRLSFAIGDAADDWEPPVSSWPDDLKATLERSNARRTTANDYLSPVITGGEGRKTLKELSRLLAGSPGSVAKLREIYDRMKPFGIWRHIAAIHHIYKGVGSRGFFADTFDHDAFLRDMKFLTRYRNVIEAGLKKARFCQDIGNVHGPRDTFREVVFFGPGLHICITQPAERTNPKYPLDIHVDTFQQGNLVVGGCCVPLPDAATAAHVISVGPYLADEAKKRVDETKERAKEYLKKKGARVPGL